MSYVPVDAVEVRVWDERVGAVALDDRLGYYVFEYYPDWARREIELAPGAMPAGGGPYVFPTLPEATFHRLPALLADSLPDDFGNALIDAWLAQHGVRKDAITALDRLAYMASRGMGALEFRASRGPRHRVPSVVELSSLVEGARSLIRGEIGGDLGGEISGDVSGDREAEAAIQNIIHVGTSAGGARAKAVIAWNTKTREIRSGQVPASPGFEQWMIKLDGIGRHAELGAGGPYGRIEYAYYLMAAAAGIRMMESMLLEENGRAHFMTKRFDRDGDSKAHVLTLCGLSQLDFRQRGTHDYSQLFHAADSLALGSKAREEIFRRMVFNVAARNCDDHTKNHSFVLDGPNSQWKLSPAYDLTFAYNPTGEWTYQHLMSINGKFRDINRDDLLAVADRQRVPRARAILSEVIDAVGQWPRFAGRAGVDPDQARTMQQTFPELGSNN